MQKSKFEITAYLIIFQKAKAFVYLLKIQKNRLLMISNYNYFIINRICRKKYNEYQYYYKFQSTFIKISSFFH